MYTYLFAFGKFTQNYFLRYDDAVGGRSNFHLMQLIHGQILYYHLQFNQRKNGKLKIKKQNHGRISKIDNIE